MASNRGIPPPQHCSPSLLVWSLASTKASPIAIAVDISKAFDTVSHCLLIEIILRSRLCHNLARWLVAYLCCRKELCLYQQPHSPPCQVRAGVPHGSVISPALFNHFVSDCPILDLDMRSYTDDFTLLAGFCSQHSGGWGEGKPTSYVPYWWGGQMASNWPLLSRNSAWPCSFPDTH